MRAPVKLTRKQLVVAAMYAAGFTTGEIARQLGIARGTVGSSLKTVRKKFWVAGYRPAEVGTKVALLQVMERRDSWTL